MLTEGDLSPYHDVLTSVTIFKSSELQTQNVYWCLEGKHSARVTVVLPVFSKTYPIEFQRKLRIWLEEDITNQLEKVYPLSPLFSAARDLFYIEWTLNKCL